MGDTNHSIRSERGFGLKLGTWGAQDGITLRETTGNVGIGTTIPSARLDVVAAGGDAVRAVSPSGNGVSGENTSSGGGKGILGGGWYGVYGQSDTGHAIHGTTTSGYGVYGESTDTNEVQNYGGYFKAQGEQGQGVYGEASGISGRGVRGVASGSSGQGVQGYATNSGDVTNYGGYFKAQGEQGQGVYGEATGIYGRGVRGVATGWYGQGVQGYASNSVDVTNYGGYFVASGTQGRGVYGEATSSWIYANNYGGYFLANGPESRGVYGKSTGYKGYGVYGDAATSLSSPGTTYGVYGQSSGNNGSAGVFGYSSNTGTTTYGVYGKAEGNSDIGVYGVSDADGELPFRPFGVYGIARGTYGVGVKGFGGSYGVYGDSINGNGVYGENTSSGGGKGILGGGWYGVYGESYTGHAVHGKTTMGYAGYFEGNVRVTGYLYKDGGGFQIDHPLEPDSKYLYHSFVESPDMMNVYNGNVLLDEKGEAVVELAEWFEALNGDFHYQLTCIGGFAPVYIAEKISGNRFKIAGGKADMEVSWQVTGIRRDAYAKANRIAVEEDKPGEARGRYLHPELYGYGEGKSIEAVHNGQFFENRQVAKNESR
jgi:hypothetical protein